MAEDTGEILRRSLDAVDTHRKRLTIALIATGLLLLGVFVTSAHPRPGGMVSALLAHFFILLLWITGLTLLVIIQITVMAKRILRAIELAWKK
jgi:hypothetical protein